MIRILRDFLRCALVVFCVLPLSSCSTNDALKVAETKSSSTVNNISASEAVAYLSNELPAAPEGVVDLSFADFFVMPIGPLGLVPTQKLLNLNHKRVRIVGFMAHEDDPSPGIFLLAGVPTNVAEKADGMADDLPAATLAVHMPAEDADKILSYRPGPWVLTGVLELGNKEDPNDRISYARLNLNKNDLHVSAKAKAASLSRAKETGK